MRLTWVSGSKEPQQVQYGDGKTHTSTVTTFSQDDMCSEFPLSIPLVCTILDSKSQIGVDPRNVRGDQPNIFKSIYKT